MSWLQTSISLGKAALDLLKDREKVLAYMNKALEYNPVKLQIDAIRDTLVYKAFIKALRQQRVRKALVSVFPSPIRKKLDKVKLLNLSREPLVRSIAYLILTPILIRTGSSFLTNTGKGTLLILTLCCAGFYRRIALGTLYEIPEDRATYLKGRTVVITGASDGLGYHVAATLASVQPSKLILGVRGEKSRRELVVEKMKSEVLQAFEFEPSITAFPLDLSSFSSVKAFGDMVKQECGEKGIDILICNAGIIGTRNFSGFKLTVDNLEPAQQVNVISHYYLIHMLHSLSLQSELKKIVMTCSSAHMFCDVSDLEWAAYSKPMPETYDAYKSYSVSKLAQIYHMRYLMKTYGDQGLNVYTVMPGCVFTKLIGRLGDGIPGMFKSVFFWVFGKDPVSGASTVVYCALSDEAKPGKYHMECRPTLMSSLAQDNEQCAKFIAYAEGIVESIENRH